MQPLAKLLTTPQTTGIRSIGLIEGIHISSRMGQYQGLTSLANVSQYLTSHLSQSLTIGPSSPRCSMDAQAALTSKVQRYATLSPNSGYVLWKMILVVMRSIEALRTVRMMVRWSLSRSSLPWANMTSVEAGHPVWLTDVGKVCSCHVRF